ncbi:hypothetical protein BN2127_JRS10_04316 [Bacillus subtilis]|nr:hypothetical protein BN2127_JRS10_04316 [Bacillus subtilis]
MKNHVKVNDKLLQTNKKWSHLRQKQKERIADWLRTEHHVFVQTHHRTPKKKEHDDILSVVMDKVNELDIWIPYSEVEKYYKSKHSKWYRRIAKKWNHNSDVEIGK